MLAPSTRTPLVYVVDDDIDVLVSFRFLLEIEGFCVRTFHSGEALLNAMTTSEADCFVVDYEMPGMSGIDLAGALRQRDINTPIILVTGRADATFPVKARAIGIRHVLVKPHLEASLPAEIWDAIGGNPPSSARWSLPPVFYVGVCP